MRQEQEQEQKAGAGEAADASTEMPILNSLRNLCVLGVSAVRAFLPYPTAEPQKTQRSRRVRNSNYETRAAAIFLDSFLCSCL